MWIVYTAIHGMAGVDLWYYGSYETRGRANEVAYELGGNYPVYHCVCHRDDAKELGVQNLPY